MAAGASFTRAAALLQILLRIDKSDLPGGSRAENYGGGASDQGGEEEDVKVQMDIEAAGKIFWCEPKQGANGLPGHDQPEGHAGEGQRDTLCEHLASETPR